MATAQYINDDIIALQARIIQEQKTLLDIYKAIMEALSDEITNTTNTHKVQKWV